MGDRLIDVSVRDLQKAAWGIWEGYLSEVRGSVCRDQVVSG